MLVLIKFPFFFKFLILPIFPNLYSYMIYLSKDIIVLLNHCLIEGFFPENWAACIQCASCHCMCVTYPS